MTDDSKAIKSFVERLAKIGVKVELRGNYPWVYLDKVNGNKVTDIFYSDHHFTLCFRPIRLDQPFSGFTDITEIFKQIRKHL